MEIATKVTIGLVAFIHCYILWFEMFAWETRGPNVFTSFPPELFASTTAIAANQGLYNGFLAAGLIWALLIRDRNWRANVAICFLLFVAIAGVFGALTVSPRILLVQTVPAVISLGLWMMGRRRP